MSWHEFEISQYNDKKYVDEVLGQGDGTTNTFNFTLSKPLVYIQGINIEYIIGGTTYNVISNASGNFSNTNVTGHVDEAGNITLNFNTAPDNGTNITAKEYISKGLCTKILEFAKGNTQTLIIGTSDGVTTHYTFTLPSNAKIGNTRLSFKKNNVNYNVYDKEYKFNNYYVADSQVNYDGTESYIDFYEPPDNTTNIYITYTTPNFFGNTWELLYYDFSKNKNGTYSFDTTQNLCREGTIRNSGTSHIEDIYVSWREWEYSNSQLWNINFNVYFSFNYDNPSFNTAKEWHNLENWDSTTKNFKDLPSIPLNNLPLKCWISINHNRIFLLVRTTVNTYETAYLGAGIRITHDYKSYPHPLLCGGCIYDNNNINNTASYHHVSYSNTTDIYNKYNYLCAINNTFQHLHGSYNHIRVFPLLTDTDTPIIEDPTGNLVLFDILYIWEKVNSEPIWYALFKLDGVKKIYYENLSPEDVIIDEDGKEYLVFPNIYRTNWRNYFVILKE